MGRESPCAMMTGAVAFLCSYTDCVQLLNQSGVTPLRHASPAQLWMALQCIHVVNALLKNEEPVLGRDLEKQAVDHKSQVSI